MAVAAVVAVVAIGPGAAAGPTTTAPAVEIRAAASSIRTITVGGQPATLALPKASTTKVVVFMHGAGGQERLPTTDNAVADATALWLRGGYALAVSRAHGQNWGNRASVDDNLALVRDLAGRGLTDVYVVGQSMGGLDALQTLRRGLRPKAWVGMAPVCDVRSMVQGGRFTSGIRKAHGSIAAAERGRSPVGIPSSAVRGLPMLFLASPGDTVVPAPRNAYRCAATARKAGAVVTLRRTTGNHGDPSSVDGARVLAHFDAAG